MIYMENEEWKDVVGYEQYFKVSNFGRIFSKRTNKILVLGINRAGYHVLSTKIGGRNGKCFCLRVHRLVAEAFLSPPDDVLVLDSNNTVYKKVPINHKDGIKTNNHVSNLEWISYSDNTKHAVNNGLLKIKTGIDHHNTQIKSLELRKSIYEKYTSSGMTITKFSRCNGISREVLRRLLQDF